MGIAILLQTTVREHFISSGVRPHKVYELGGLRVWAWDSADKKALTGLGRRACVGSGGVFTSCHNLHLPARSSSVLDLCASIFRSHTHTHKAPGSNDFEPQNLAIVCAETPAGLPTFSIYPSPSLGF